MAIKKPVGLGLVIGLLALAFTALPAMAQAAPTLRSGGKVVGVGSKVLATSSTLKTVTSAGTLTCSNVTLNGTVLTNPPAALSGTGTASGCLVNGAVPAEITSISFTDNFLANHTDEGTAEFKYDVPLAGLSNCVLKGPISSTWANASANVNITESTLAGSGAGCPTSGVLSGALALETEAGAAVTVNDE